MSAITIPTFNLPNVHNYSGTVKLRIWYTGCVGPQFIASDSSVVMCGSIGGNWYVEVPISIVGTDLVVPGFTLTSTDDSNTATVLASGVFVVNGARKDDLFGGWIIPSTLGASVTFAALWIWNEQVTPSATLNPAYLTAPQVAALLLAMSLVNRLKLFTTWYDAVADGGMVGDGVTDNTAALQALLDLIDSLDTDATIFFPAGTYIIAGALTDTSFSNSQIVLPKRSISQSMITIRLLGASPAAQAWPTEAGSILKSTLASGNGSMIGVKCNWGSATTNPALDAHNRMTFIMFVDENMTFRLPANPTNSGLDLRFVHREKHINSRIDVVGITAGAGPITPDLLCTEPTTASSYGLLTAMDYIGSATIIENLTIEGYYNGMRWGELVNANNLTIGATKIGIEVRGASHPSSSQKILFVSTAIPIKALGRDPYFTNLTGTDYNTLDIQQLDIENSSALMAWAATTAHISDAGNLLRGDIYWYQGWPGSSSTQSTQSLIVVGGAGLHLHQIARAFHSRNPVTEFTGGSDQFQLLEYAIDETARGLATSDDTKIAWKLLSTMQSGINHIVGVIAGVNSALGAALEKRLGQIVFKTDGATNSGRIQFWTMKAGVLTNWGGWDKDGDHITGRFQVEGLGAALASANTITPTNSVHHITGTTVIKTINVSAAWAGFSTTLTLIPDAAFTTDATGNIAIASTAVVGKAMIMTYDGTTNKWYPSY